VQTRDLAAIYLGCVGLLVGGAGLTHEKTSPGNKSTAVESTAPALFVQASVATTPAPSSWPPEPAAASVAYLDEWITLTTPAPQAETPSTQDRAGTDALGEAQISADAQRAASPRRGRSDERAQENVYEVPRQGSNDKRRTGSRIDRRREVRPDDASAPDVAREGTRYFRVEREDDDRIDRERYRDHGGREVDIRVRRGVGPITPREQGLGYAPTPFRTFGPFFER
jgi:hypothetical protein